MSTLKVEKIQHPNSASVALTLDTSGYLALQAGSASTPAIQGPSDPNTGIFFPAADTIAFAEGGTEVLRIDSNGRVGIGSSSPSQKLTSVGNIKIAGAQASNVANVILTRTDTSWSINNETDLRFYSGTGDTDSPSTANVVFTNGGRIGVGTNNPAGTLHLAGTYPLLYLTDTDATGAARSAIGCSDGNLVYYANENNQAGGNHIFYRNGANESARLDSSGRLLVGTTSAYVNALLNLERASTASGAVVANIRNTSATSTTKDTNTILRVSANGSGADVVINCTDGVSYNYNFGGNNGGAYVMATTNGVRLSNGGTSWASDSDERVKDIIEPIENGLDKISTLRAVIGKYKTDDEDKRRSFLIAQDVQAVLPEAVYDEQGTLMLAYTDTIPLLVAALKESKERLEQLEAKVTALESV